METINVDFVKNSGRLTGPSNIIKLVREKFSIKNPSYQMRRIVPRLYSITPIGAFQIGMWHDIENYIRSLNVPIKFIFSDAFKKAFKPSLKINDISKISGFDYYDYQEDTIKEFIKHGRGISLVATGGGKCFGKGVEVLLYSGEYKKVEDIVVGDCLMGPDSLSREVTSLARGQEEMFKITGRGIDDFVVNGSHILSFKTQNNDIVNISVKEYLDMPDHEQSLLKAWKSECVNWKDAIINDEKLQKITSPYALGAMIRNFYTTPTKNIPEEYMFSSEKYRLELVAGIIDTYGNFKFDKNDNLIAYEVEQYDKNITDDVVFICRSLGFHAKYKKCVKRKQYSATDECYIINISGDLSKIPCKNPNKKVTNFSDEEKFLGIDISVKSIGVGDYYGFEVSGPDRLFLLKDFTVTHNSLIQAGMVKTLLDNYPNFKILIVVPNVSLLNQLYYSFINEYDLPDVTRWGDSNLPDLSKNILIANSQILISNIPNTLKIVEDFDVVIVDEVHTINEKKNKISKVIHNIKTPFKFGLTGTLPDNLMSAWNVIGKIGPILYEKTSYELRKQQTITDVEIKVIVCKHSNKPFFPRGVNPTDQYNSEYDYVINCDARNDIIAKIANRLIGNTLIVVDRLQYIDVLKAKLDLTDKKIFVITGDTPTDERTMIQNTMDQESNIVCIAMSKCFSTGISIKNLHYAILAYMGKGGVKTVQTIGRTVRKHESKSKAVIFDIADDLTYSAKQLRQRLEIYKEQKIDYAISKMTI